MTHLIPDMVWLDIETTGLNLDIDAVMEVGLIVTDKFGRELPDLAHSWIVSNPGDREFIERGFLGAPENRFDDFVINTHVGSGLFADWNASWKRDDRTDALQVQEQALAFLDGIFGKDAKLPMCGSSIHFDRYMLQANMHMLHNWFSHRNIDVSAIREVAKLVNPRIVELEPQAARKTHRVLDDLRDSIEGYRFFLDEFLMVGVDE